MQVTASAKPIYAPASLHRGCAALLSAGPPQEGQRFAAGPLLFQSPTTKAIAFAKLRNLYAQGAWASICAHTATEGTMHDSYSSQNIYSYFQEKRKQVATSWAKDSKSQGFKASGIQGLKDSSIQGLKDSGIQGLKGSRMERLNDSCLGICSKTTTPDFPELKLWIPPEQSIRRHLFQSTGAQT